MLNRINQGNFISLSSFACSVCMLVWPFLTKTVQPFGTLHSLVIQLFFAMTVASHCSQNLSEIWNGNWMGKTLLLFVVVDCCIRRQVSGRKWHLSTLHTAASWLFFFFVLWCFVCSMYEIVRYFPMYSSEFLLQAFILRKKTPLNLDGRIRIVVLVCVVYSSVNFIHYSCPCMDFIIIKSGFTPE